MKSHKKLLSLILSVSTLFCCFTNLFVMASDIDVSNYTYVVDNMTFYKGNAGDTQIDSLLNATVIGIDITEIVPSDESATLIVAAYSSDGTFISKSSTLKDFSYNKTDTVKFKLSIPVGKTVSEIRAFVWKSFSDMTPLSNTLSSNNNMIIVPRNYYNEDTRFAVVTEDGAIPALVDDEEGFYEIEVLYGENDVVTLIATDEDELDLLNLWAGDVIFFKTNSAGYIEDIDVIFHFDDGIPSYADLASMSLVNDNEDNNVDGITITSTGANFGTGVFTQDWDATATDTVKLVYGPIAEVTANYISFAKIYNGETDIFTDVQEYDIAPEINVYKYNYGSKARFKFSAITNTTGDSIVAPAYITKFIQDNDDVIDWDDATAKHYEKANFAFALVVEDEVVEIFEFVAE